MTARWIDLDALEAEVQPQRQQRYHALAADLSGVSDTAALSIPG
jgi:hypothetical protein